jgi:hypothetical protein
MPRPTKGAVIAGAALALVVSGGVQARNTDKAKDDEEVFCAGINTCKGEGTCKGAHNDCAWENTCKGKGVIESTRKECREKRGRIVPEPVMCDNCRDEEEEKPIRKGKKK